MANEPIFKTIFYLISALTVFFAFRLVVARNLFHSAIFLAMTLIGVACVYLYLDAEFLAMAQILIYVGAIVTLFLFAIMLTANIQDKSIIQTNKLVFISIISAALFILLLLRMLNGNSWIAAGTPGQASGLSELGKSLMTTYVLPFEVISVILIAVLVGAVVIGRVDRK